MIIDHLINTFDTALRTVFTEAKATRDHPDAAIEGDTVTDAQKEQVIALMRINHVGEICAQALYSGQAFTSRNPQIVKALAHAATEETDHLAWCESRIKALGGRKSLLNPLWYIGSFTIGAVAGAIGDKWNLGFLAETEQQVSAHLSNHLALLPSDDKKTRAIIEQMHIDETSHAQEAVNLGAAELPDSVKKAMKVSSKIMTTTAYYV
ncbi:MAG: 2-polyprenyl-3-methyl-6-methoxy-1,4-benzoquinone monooxygenase [Methylotenera sp.]|jgi:3-demethoxyubiquinol 3-hydroxylase